MAATSHLHSPSHSPRYLLALLILLLPTVLVSLLAFLVDILLFVPHLQWGGWIVLAATIILVACGVVTCAMRRTLVSRKARKKLVAENAEMSGENFYNRQRAEAVAAQLAEAESPPPLPINTDVKAPLITGNSHSDSAPTFSTYASSRNTDEIPLTSGEEPGFYENSSRPMRPGYHGPRDEYGNPIPLELQAPLTPVWSGRIPIGPCKISIQTAVLALEEDLKDMARLDNPLEVAAILLAVDMDEEDLVRMAVVVVDADLHQMAEVVPCVVE